MNKEMCRLTASVGTLNSGDYSMLDCEKERVNNRREFIKFITKKHSHKHKR